MLTAFTAGLLLITVSELGDKTFFIAALLAMRHSRRLTLVGVLAALAAMNTTPTVSVVRDRWINSCLLAMAPSTRML